MNEVCIASVFRDHLMFAIFSHMFICFWDSLLQISQQTQDTLMETIPGCLAKDRKVLSRWIVTSATRIARKRQLPDCLLCGFGPQLVGCSISSFAAPNSILTVYAFTEKNEQASSGKYTTNQTLQLIPIVFEHILQKRAKNRLRPVRKATFRAGLPFCS